MNKLKSSQKVSIVYFKIPSIVSFVLTATITVSLINAGLDQWRNVRHCRGHRLWGCQDSALARVDVEKDYRESMDSRWTNEIIGGIKRPGFSWGASLANVMPLDCVG